MHRSLEEANKEIDRYFKNCSNMGMFQLKAAIKSGYKNDEAESILNKIEQLENEKKQENDVADAIRRSINKKIKETTNELSKYLTEKSREK